MTKTFDTNTDFKCVHCCNFVSAAILLAGVHNRNHCPYCLWSRHMDLFKAGDRLSACKDPMEPIGLTMKQRHKKYPASSGGELMLVHRCSGCGGFSINRIAADDDAQGILEVFHTSAALPADLRGTLHHHGIVLLDRGSLERVHLQLFGHTARPLARKRPVAAEITPF